MGDEKSRQLLQFARTLKWEDHISDPVVQDELQKIFDHVSGGKQGGDVDVSGAQRIKLVVVGDGAIGKTSLLIRFATGEFPTEYLPTVFENYTAQLKRDDGVILLHLWDTAGQEEYDRLRPLSYPGADVVLLAFSTISQPSLNAVREKWAPEIDHYIPNIPHILVGTKIDLRESKVPDPHSGTFEPVTRDMGEALKTEVGSARYMEVSSKTGQGLNEIFDEAVKLVLDQRKPVASHSNNSSSAKRGTVKKKKKDGCIIN